MFTIEKEKLEELYTKQCLTTIEIGKIYGVSYQTILRKLRFYNIPVREKGNIDGKPYVYNPQNKIVLTDEEIDKCKCLYEINVPVNEIANELGLSRKAIIRYSKDLGWKRTKSMMSREQYDDSMDDNIVKMYKEGKSSPQIAKELGVTHRTILNHLKHTGTNRRTLSESQFNYNNKEIPEILDDYEKLYQLYVVERKSKRELSDLLNVSPNVINRKFKEYGIKIRGCSEAFKGISSGEKHPNWKGGITDLFTHVRYFTYKNLAKETYKRDGYRCQLCGSTKNLHAHHIRHFKDIFQEILSEHPELNPIQNKNELFNIMVNDRRILDLDNLITYCADCHLYEIHGFQKKVC
jgi:DNA-binding CsgD family transcriptional regulator